MRVAIPVWQGRLSPVFDVAGQLLIVELKNGREDSRRMQPLMSVMEADRVAELVGLGVNVVICGGISQTLETALTEKGIKVFARLCGDVEEVLAAFLSGCLGEPRFAMPGCCGPWRRRMGRGRGWGKPPWTRGKL